MNPVLWTTIAVLVVTLGVLQLVGVRALASWGVAPSRAVIALRTLNFVVVVGGLAFAAYTWAGR